MRKRKGGIGLRRHIGNRRYARDKQSEPWGGEEEEAEKKRLGGEGGGRVWRLTVN